jgi:hypothetical protein
MISLPQLLQSITISYKTQVSYFKNFSSKQIKHEFLGLKWKKGIIIAQYLQRVTKNLDLGTELILQYGRNVPNNRMALYSVGWRYFGTQWQLSGALNPLGSLHLCYHHQSKSPIQFGVELESNVRTMESLCTFNYQAELNKANMTFKGNYFYKCWILKIIIEINFNL